MKPPMSSQLLIGCGWVIPGPFMEPVLNGAVAVENGKISAVGPIADLRQRFPGFTFVDVGHKVALPGLFNSHTHVAMGFFRGLGHGKQNMIESFLFPAEKSLSEELLEPLSYSYIFDGLRSGVTSFVDHYYFSQPVGRAFERIGTRAWLGETIADLGGAFPGRESFIRAKKLIESSKFSTRIRHTVAPHAADTLSKELLTEVSGYARSTGLPLHMHLSQTPGELDRVRAREKSTAVEFAAACGALTDRSLVVHLTSATNADLGIIKSSGATIGWCPSSTVIYDKLAPVSDFFAYAIPLALGTDCPASCDHGDMLSEMRTAGLFARHSGVAHESLSPDHLLAMATTLPAAVLGVSEALGTLAPGKLADMVFLDINLSGLPMTNPLANVIFSLGSRDVDHVMVDGRWILWDKSLVQASEIDLRSAYVTAVQEIKTRVAGGRTP